MLQMCKRPRRYVRDGASAGNAPPSVSQPATSSQMAGSISASGVSEMPIRWPWHGCRWPSAPESTPPCGGAASRELETRSCSDVASDLGRITALGCLHPMSQSQTAQETLWDGRKYRVQLSTGFGVSLRIWIEEFGGWNPEIMQDAVAVDPDFICRIVEADLGKFGRLCSKQLVPSEESIGTGEQG